MGHKQDYYESHTKHSQRDDPGGEALGDSLGVHTEGAVFGAGAGRRTAGYLRGSPGIQLPRQAKTQSPQTDQPRPSLSESQHLGQEEGEGIHLLKFLLSGLFRGDGQPAYIPSSSEKRERGWGGVVLLSGCGCSVLPVSLRSCTLQE